MSILGAQPLTAASFTNIRSWKRTYSNADDTSSILPQFWADLQAQEVRHHSKVCERVCACARAHKCTAKRTCKALLRSLVGTSPLCL